MGVFSPWWVTLWGKPRWQFQKFQTNWCAMVFYKLCNKSGYKGGRGVGAPVGRFPLDHSVGRRDALKTWRLWFSLFLSHWCSARVSYCAVGFWLNFTKLYDIGRWITFLFFSPPLGEALRCYCGGTKYCSQPVETCHGPNPQCGSVIIYAGSSECFGLHWGPQWREQLVIIIRGRRWPILSLSMFSQDPPTSRAAWHYTSAWRWISRGSRLLRAAGPTSATDKRPWQSTLWCYILLTCSVHYYHIKALCG